MHTCWRWHPRYDVSAANSLSCHECILSILQCNLLLSQFHVEVKGFAMAMYSLAQALSGCMHALQLAEKDTDSTHTRQRIAMALAV